jgi:hypothetical protein
LLCVCHFIPRSKTGKTHDRGRAPLADVELRMANGIARLDDWNKGFAPSHPRKRPCPLESNDPDDDGTVSSKRNSPRRSGFLAWLGLFGSIRCLTIPVRLPFILGVPVCQSDERAPVLVALEHGSRRQNASSFALPFSRAARQDSYRARRFSSFH